MRSVQDLTNVEEPAIELLRQWASETEVPCKFLAPSANREKVLLDLQVTTHSTLGAVAYETGGVLIDDGWLRLLGSGHPDLRRTLSDWNLKRADGYMLIGDDVVGGFFAINGGAFGSKVGSVYYWAPDNLDWECLEVGYTDFVCAFMSTRIAEFYESLRWSNWRADIRDLSSDRCFSFYPFLWTRGGSPESSRRAQVPIAEAFDLKVDIVRQLSSSG